MTTTRIVDFTHGLVDANQKPIDPMMKRVQSWLMAGDQVEAFIDVGPAQPELFDNTRKWLDNHGLQDVDLTNTVDFLGGAEFWSTRVVQISKDGRPVGVKAGYARDA